MRANKLIKQGTNLIIFKIFLSMTFLSLTCIFYCLGFLGFFFALCSLSFVAYPKLSGLKQFIIIFIILSNNKVVLLLHMVAGKILHTQKAYT
jgi:hypothetical protein